MTSYDLKRILAEELARIVPGDAGKRRTRFDYVLPGFGERIHPSGRKSYVLQRTMGGKQRLITIGDAAILTERIAKDVARRLILRIELGQNPADRKQRGKKTPTYASFLRHYWEVAAPTWKPSTLEIHDIYRRTHLEHAFAGKFIDEISHADAVRWHAMLTRSAGPGAANRAMEILKAMFGKAEAWGYLPDHSNPFRGVKRNKGRKIERFLSQAEMARLGAALARHRATKPNEVAVISLLALTGCRRGEILDLTWGEVQGRKLKLIDSKTGPRIVWLGKEARGLLDGLPRGKKDQQVFHFDLLPVSAIEGFWRILRVEAGIEDVRLHDLRHNYASLAARSSETLPIIGNLLGHRQVRTTARYSHLDDATILAAACVVGANIETHFARSGGFAAVHSLIVARISGHAAGSA
ncbi:site-specific integrase [Aurantiacibacter poecillastricola]|uniref:site-specific integrase n=1 Tax=Aurantiacibacter poecillastricola TaxID=3064385 RepID=UPI00273E5C4A|nr:site-specific integrase [Aurantiacibacter sp. 219JJ12-13]MDP5263636.1 site-specific integrase [Aurantiacibacter sp. 219JJ12-13]